MTSTLKRILSITIALCMLLATVTCLSVSAAETTTVTNDENPYGLVYSTEIGNIASTQQALYTAEVEYTGIGKVELLYSTMQLFYIENGVLKVGSKLTGGTYEKGTYKIDAIINPTQKMLTVKVTLPDGGIITRGFNELNGGSSMDYYIIGASKVKKSSVTFEDFTPNTYSVPSSVPSYTGMDLNIYNIVTSFDIAQTTRNFAFTVAASFVGANDSIALKYRKVGDTDWATILAIKEEELVETADEDYYKCDLTGLSADTEYEYIIGKLNGSDTEWTSPIKFKTAAEEIDEFTFIAIGDTQGEANWGHEKYGYAAYQEAFEEVNNPAFILNTGDVVENGTIKDHWNYFFKALNKRGASTAFFPTVGNHDAWNVENASRDSFYFNYHFNNPNNGGSAAFDQSYASNFQTLPSYLQFFGEMGDETVYSFNYGDAHFVVLNTGSTNDLYSGARDKLLLTAQRAWLINDLEANKDAKWTIMMFHAPVYNFLGGVYDRDFLNDVIEGYGVDLVLQGHTHLVTRTYPMKNGEIVTKAVESTIPKGIGTIYTTIGATKGSHTSFTNYTEYDETAQLVVTPVKEQPTYTTVSVSGDKLTVTIKQVNGFVVDTFTIDENAELPGIEEQPFVGDSSNLAIPIAILFFSTVVLAVLSIKSFKKN